MGIGAPISMLRTARFPKMGRRERERAARFDSARFVRYPISDAAVRVMPVDAQRTLIGVAPRDALRTRIDAARTARLDLVAIDDHGFAFLRAFPNAHAVLDIGAAATTLIIPGEAMPTSTAFQIAGRSLTAAIVAALGIDESAAEARKRQVGLAGAGEHVCDTLVELVASSLIEARASGRPPVTSITLAGNGARLIGLAERLEAVLAIPVSDAIFRADVSETLPTDVLRAAAPDWGLAYGLALHRTR
jgi:Tfp pilus assembly PilM family ATPase